MDEIEAKLMKVDESGLNRIKLDETFGKWMKVDDSG